MKRYVPSNTINLHPEPHEWCITLQLDIDGRKIYTMGRDGLRTYNPDVLAALEALVNRIDVAIRSDAALMSTLKRTGITVVEISSEEA